MTDNAHWYRSETMPRTPEGRNEVRKIAGEPGVIARRADDIKDLGEAMSQAARTLQLFADGHLGKGDWLEGVRDQAREVWEDLEIAGKRYTPSGAALATYATALDTAQAATDGVVSSAETAWERVRNASYNLMEAEQEQRSFDAAPVPEDGTAGERPDSSAEQGEFDAAVEDWERYCRAYDGPRETWEDAYETARKGLEEVNENGVEDGFWDDMMPFVEGLIFALQIVGLVALVFALVLTGPLAAVLMAVVLVTGLLVLALEATKFFAGRGSWKSLGLAFAGVLPFGKLAHLGKLGQLPGFFPKVMGGLRMFGDDLIKGKQALGVVDDLAKARFDISDAAWLTRHGLNTRNMLRTFSLDALGRGLGVNAYPDIVRGLAGFKPGELPANLAEGLLGMAQGTAQMANAADFLNGLAT